MLQEDEIIQKQVLNRKFLNRRAMGKPRTRWEDIIWKDTSQILGTLGWKKQAEEREE